MWTQFWDMHSGGGQKEDFAMCYIEADEQEAKVIFYNRFGHNPERVTCTCCGDDYSISSDEDLSQITAFHRGCAYGYLKDGKRISEDEGFVSGKGVRPGVVAKYLEEPDTRYSYKKYIPLKEYLKQSDVKVIYAKDIKPEERTGEVPDEGYIWH